MQTIERPPEFSHDRRRFLGVAALSLTAMQLGPIGPAKAQGGPAGGDQAGHEHLVRGAEAG